MTPNTNNTNTRNVNDVASIVRMCEKMIGEAVARLNDLNFADKQRVEELRQADKQRIDDMFKQQNEFSAAILKERDERLLQKFDSLATAINKAEIATEHRFEGVNEFRAQLADQQKTFLCTSEYKQAHQNLLDLVTSSIKTLSDIILAQKERIDKIENLKTGGQNVWVTIVGVVAFLSALFSIALHFVK